MRKLLLVCVLLLGTALPAAAQRLSGEVVPDHYTLWFAPDLKTDTFRGRADIRVRLQRPTTTITLNAAELTFQQVRVTAGGRTQDARVTVDAAGETATFTVAEPLAAGEATIGITYTGMLNDKLRGFYRSEANGRKYAVTQMEATDARRAFPSFDEPSFKATFELSLMVDAGDSVISNGAQLSDTPGPEPGKHTLRFAPTAKMSTYLVAMIVGDFVCREGGVDGTPIRICSTPDKRGLTAFALEAAQQQLHYYNTYFGIPYPFGKLDIVAIPDFAAGAMENAGAITFRERLLLIDETRASLAARKNVAAVISHEIAHQWFGNLVTMRWWDDIWLNEGFATWAANKPLAEWRPEWNVHLDDAADTQGALGLDALQSTRAIRTRVNTPEEINEVFDGIAYEKSAAVLRMIEGFVGADAFRAGVTSYLKAHAFGNAAGEQFWDEMTRVTGRPVDRIMRSLVEQAGAPVVSLRTTCDAGRTRATLRQERFLGSPDAPPPAAQTWTIPVCLSSGGTSRCDVVDARERRVELAGCAPVYGNARARGYYFTDYAPASVRALAAAAARLEPVERLALLGDEWWMVRGGRHDIGTYFDLAAALAGDDNAAVTAAIAARVSYADAYLVPAAERGRYQAWVRARFAPALQALGLPGPAGDDDLRESRRATLVELLGITGNDAATQRTARQLATAYMADPAALPGTLAPTVLRVAASAGDAGLYDQYVARLTTLGGQPEEFYRFFTALPWFRDPALVQRTLEYAVSPAVRSQDTSTLIGGLMARPWGRDAAWTFVQQQWPALVQKLGVFQGIPGIIGSTGALCSTTHAASVRQFFEKNPVPAAARGLQQAIERIEACATLAARQAPATASWVRTAAAN